MPRPGGILTAQTAAEAAALLLLGANGIRDIERKEIFLELTLLAVLPGLIYCLRFREEAFREVLPAFLPGIALLLFAAVSSQSIGCGDGILTLVLGLYVSARTLVLSLMLGFFGAAVWAGILLLKKRRGSGSLPFVPLLLAGYVLVLVSRLF